MIDCEDIMAGDSVKVVIVEQVGVFFPAVTRTVVREVYSYLNYKI